MTLNDVMPVGDLPAAQVPSKLRFQANSLERIRDET